MPARTRKRKTSEEEEEGTEHVTKPTNKTARTTKKKAKATQEESSKRSDKGAPKKGGADVKGATVNGKKQAKPSATSANEETERQANEVLRLLEDGAGSQKGTSRRSLFSSKIDAILKDGGGLTANKEVETRCVVYESVHGRIKHLQELMDEFDTINKSTINIRKPTESQQWARDAEDLAKVDKKAMEVAIQMLNSVVIAGEYSTLSRASARSGSEVERAAWRWLEGGMPAAEDTWGSTARETVRAFAGITKLLQ
ncbi:hypothetical protein HDV57DRAFT_497239 [Trichoderma longibrachiatum]